MAVTGLSTNFRIRNASDFVDYIQSDENRIYVFLGRTGPWPDEQTPPPAVNDIQEITQAWQDLNGIKEITPADIRVGLREIVWTRNTVYAQYADDVDLSGKDFYVLTDQLNVYKCISNNNDGPSTIQPSHTTFDIPLEPDGYKWKYMYTLTSSLLRKFIVPGFIPVNPNPVVEGNAVPGTIDNIRIDSPGSGYPSSRSISLSNEIPVFVEGDGNQNSSATATINVVDGQIISVSSITSGGVNYPYAPEQNIPVALRQLSSSGIVQTAYGIASTNPSGEIDTVEVLIGGSGYITGTVNIVQSSCRAYAETNNAGSIVNVDIPTGRTGQNFTRASAIVVAETGSGASLKPIISPYEGHGYDAARELGANYVLINLRVSGQVDFLGLNDFRRVGLLENPKSFGSADSDGVFQNYTADLGDSKYRLTVSSGDNSLFQEGEEVVGLTSGARGIQMNRYENDKIRVSIDNSLSGDLSFQVGETIIGQSSGTQETISAITDPDIEPYEGEILYINNRELIESENPQQIETITLVLEY